MHCNPIIVNNQARLGVDRKPVPRWRTWALRTLPVLVVSLAGATAYADDTEARIAAGEVVVVSRNVPGCDLPEATVHAVIDAPPAAVWKIIDDCANYKKTMVRIIESKELSRNGNVTQCQVTVEMPMPISNLTSVAEATSVQNGATYKRTWKLVRGDYKRNEGSWTISPYDAEGKRSRIVYRVLADPNISVPNFIIKKAQAKALPDMIEKIRSRLTGR